MQTLFLCLFLPAPVPDRELPRRRRLQRPRGRRVLRGRTHLRPRPRRRQGRPPRHRLDEPQPTSQNQPPTKQILIQPFFPQPEYLMKNCCYLTTFLFILYLKEINCYQFYPFYELYLFPLYV